MRQVLPNVKPVMEDTPAVLDETDLPALQLARQLWGQSRWDEATASFVRIAAEHPRNLHALVDAARALGDRLQIRRARELVDKLSALACVFLNNTESMFCGISSAKKTPGPVLPLVSLAGAVV